MGKNTYANGDTEYMIPHYPISVTVNKDGVGTIKSDLKEQYEDKRLPMIGAQINAIESFILALACEGIDVSDSKFAAAIGTCLEAIENNI